MFMKPSLKNADARFILARVRRGRQKLEPNRVKPEPSQPQHPLQRHRIIAAAFRIFRRKPAANKDGHRHRIVCLSTGSSRDGLSQTQAGFYTRAVG